MSYPLAAQMQWPSLAQDLALLMVPNSPIKGIDEVCATYNLSRQDLKAILQVPYFQTLLNTVMEEVRKQGSRAGVRYRALMLSQALAEKLFRDANDGTLKPVDSVKFLGELLKMSGLNSDKGETQVNTQVNVQLPIPQGIPKVAHCLPQRENQ